MWYRRLADGVVLLHMAIGVFFLFGAGLVKLVPWLALVHIPLAVWICAAFIMGWTCPLTPLENHLRRWAGERGYQGSFVDHYLGPALGAAPPSPETPVHTKTGRRNEAILGVAMAVVNTVVYVGLFYKDMVG